MQRSCDWFPVTSAFCGDKERPKRKHAVNGFFAVGRTTRITIVFCVKSRRNTNHIFDVGGYNLWPGRYCCTTGSLPSLCTSIFACAKRYQQTDRNLNPFLILFLNLTPFPSQVMWCLLYVPTELGPFAPVSRSWAFLTPDRGDLPDEWIYVIFDWDNIFASYIFGLDNKVYGYALLLNQALTIDILIWVNFQDKYYINVHYVILVLESYPYPSSAAAIATIHEQFSRFYCVATSDVEYAALVMASQWMHCN